MGTIEALFGDDAAVLRRFEFQLLLLATVPAALATSIVSPILEALTGPFGVSASTVGLMVTAFFAPAIVVTPVAGSLADRYGRKPLLVVALLLFGAGGVAVATTTDFRLVLVYRLLQGVGSGVLLPVLVTAIGDLYVDDEEAAAQGFRTAVHALSGAIVPVFAGILVAVAWQYPFLIYGVCFPIAALVLLFFEEPARAADGGDASTPGLGDLLALVGQPHVLSIVLAYAVPAFLVVAFLTYNSILVVRGIGGSPRDAGVLAAVSSLSIAAAATQAGRVTAFFDSRRVPLVAGNLAIGAGLVAVALSPSLGVATVAVAALGGGVGLLMSLYRSVVTAIASERLRGGLVSLGETSRVAGATAAPLVVGALIEVARPTLGVVGAVRWTNAAVGVVGAVVGLFLVATARVGTDAPEADP